MNTFSLFVLDPVDLVIQKEMDSSKIESTKL